MAAQEIPYNVTGTSYTPSQLESFTVDQLSLMCQVRYLPYSHRNKEELIKQLAEKMKQERADSIESYYRSSPASKNTNCFVKNINGTSQGRYDRARWLMEYRRVSGSEALYCPRNGCTSLAAVGAHVQIKDGRKSEEWYIIPLCSACNNNCNTDEMVINANTTFVNVTSIH